MAITGWRGISGLSRGRRRMDIASFASVGAARAAGRTRAEDVLRPAPDVDGRMPRVSKWER